MRTTSLKTESVPSRDWSSRDVLDRQFTHGIRLAPRPACAADCADQACVRLAMIAEVVTDYLSRPFSAGESSMPLVLLRTWLGWRMQREHYGRVSEAPRHAFTKDALDIVTWALGEPHSGLSIVRLSTRRMVAA